MFSPYYAWSRRHGTGDPLDHCAINAVLYGRGARRWTMTERGRTGLRRDAAHLAIGPSSLRWDGSALIAELDEIATPLPRRLRGTIRVHPMALTDDYLTLDADGAHRWRPIAPRARVEVSLTHPDLRWSGVGYVDTNVGTGPLEQAFRRWDWSRCATRDGTAILYDVTGRDGSHRGLALHVDRAGRAEPLLPPRRVALPRSRWLVERYTRGGDDDAPSRVLHTLLDAPFYARSVIASTLYGETVAGMHESLSLDRFRTPWVQAMLPFRMPRVARTATAPTR